jgi:uncharacterized membrane protein
MPDTKQQMIRTALSPNRLEALTDGVFAIVMTLLVLGLGVPVFKGTSMNQELTQLLEIWPKFASYVLTFLTLGFMWSMHHRQFSLIKRSDSLLTWINILFLMFTALLPFSTSLLAEYMGQQLPILIYSGNYFMCMLVSYLNLSYATGKYRLVDTDIDFREVRLRKIMFLSSMVLAVIVMGVSYLNTIVSMGIFVVFLISGLIYTTVRFRVRSTKQMVKELR